MVTSVFNVASGGRREGKGGIEPLSTVKTDLKYSFNNVTHESITNEILQIILFFVNFHMTLGNCEQIKETSVCSSAINIES